MRLARFALTVAILWPAAVVGISLGNRPAVAEDAVETPWTREKIYWRTESSGRLGAKSKRVKGRLIVDENVLRIETRKKNVEIPLDQIELIFPTTFGGDVDSQWVAIQVSEEIDGRPRLYGLRDARKLGFGIDTPKIASELLAVMESLGQAQFRAEPGYLPYTALDERMVFLLPEDWKVTVLSEIYESGRLTSGHSKFFPPDRDDVSLELLVRPATRGYRCKEFPLRKIDPRPSQKVESVEIAHCSAARVTGIRTSDGRGRVRWLVANGDTHFELTLLAPESQLAGYVDIAERVVVSWRLATKP